MIEFIILFIIAFFGTIYVLPHSIRKLAEREIVVTDMYKSDRRKIATNAGMILIFTSFLSISISPLILRIFDNFFVDVFFEVDNGLEDLNKTNLAFLLVVALYTIYGLVDDLVDLSRIMKLFLPIMFSFPLIQILYPENIWLPFLGIFDLETIFYSHFTFTDLFRVLVIPVYVMVVVNLVNMHSGYNGQQTGLSILVIITIFLKAFEDGNYNQILPVAAILGAMCAFWIYNRYPSRVFEGNIGSMLFGSTIGVMMVIQEYWWFGFFIMIPHTFNFLLWIIWLILMKKAPDQYLETNGNHKKFGEVRVDGTIKVPNRLTLKWIPNYYFRLRERHSVWICYSITIFFCISGLIIF